MTRITSSQRWMAAIGSALALLLSACGGGGGVGSGGTGAMAVGTVDGFGSVFIGGERCDDIGARIVHDTVAGGPEPAQAELKLGQRVEAELDGTLNSVSSPSISTRSSRSRKATSSRSGRCSCA